MDLCAMTLPGPQPCRHYLLHFSHWCPAAWYLAPLPSRAPLRLTVTLSFAGSICMLTFYLRLPLSSLDHGRPSKKSHVQESQYNLNIPAENRQRNSWPEGEPEGRRAPPGACHLQLVTLAHMKQELQRSLQLRSNRVSRVTQTVSGLSGGADCHPCHPHPPSLLPTSTLDTTSLVTQYHIRSLDNQTSPRIILPHHALPSMTTQHTTTVPHTTLHHDTIAHHLTTRRNTPLCNVTQHNTTQHDQDNKWLLESGVKCCGRPSTPAV
ncbi:hypothetical protein E2C01_005421 [Portunus trituberculatus]|uniref:Uncharacterized protein n=1 Tax=Portunus trituberculatus TaxID=210409 RepID=A0A5B7CWM0_PORTR|nr:hypothetical protein [Portunus trituberculatus]